jgi:uncharacterized protein (UPF0332 family)
MKLSEEERKAVVVLRLQKAKETLSEVKDIMELGYWRTAANRLYYACYYATSALLIKYGYSAHTHSGVISLLGLHFVSKGIISKESGKFYGRLFELRQTGDYDDWIVIEATDVEILIKPAEDFVCLLEQLIQAKNNESD